MLRGLPIAYSSLQLDDFGNSDARHKNSALQSRGGDGFSPSSRARSLD
jgi:hypothetical protein